MQKISLSMITILLFVQILSNGFAQLPTVVDDEILEEDVEIPSLTSARNNTSCGSNSSLTDLWASTDSSTWGTWSNGVYGYYDVNCTVIGNNYTLEATISNSAGSWSSYSFWNWSETNSHEYMSEAWTNLTAGTYCVNATLWDVSSGTFNYVDSDYPCFTLTNSSGSGNNTGGNNTGGNNTGGNNTGGNNTGGNNTGGNNTGGNNTGGNNTGGNNTGGNNNTANNDSHCLTVGNFTISSTYFVTIDLINTCSFDINYPGINASADDSGVSGFYNQTSWWYMIGGNGTYNLSVQLVFDSSVQNGTNITLDFEAVILNCGINGAWHDCPNSTLSYQFIFVSNNTGGNNTGGNNTGGNNTGGNNTVGNNTGGNNTGGNNTDGNNTGGNNTVGNNTGENNNGDGNTNNNSQYADNDSDGISDEIDNCPMVANANQTDNDGDGLGDACDLDIDGDGVDNQNDALPNNGNETIDTDNDGLGDNADDDDDGDGMNDSNDAFPTDPTEQSDLDGDGVGDNIDADDDGDGITDTTDNCPLIVNPDQADLDGDGVGTACDGIELSVDENGTISGDGTALPSIGVLGTIAAISAGFIFATRREDEE
jgi:hypothetical protein